MFLTINNNIFNVKCLLTEKDIQEGMMNKKFDDNFDGLLFFMNGKNHSFWMKNCIIPLDIIFIQGKTISSIHHNCPPCKEDPCEGYKGFGDLVLELPGGTCKKYDIKEGDTIELSRD
jgi:uncharacterized membrane protein (UPF0127 family)